MIPSSSSQSPPPGVPASQRLGWLWLLFLLALTSPFWDLSHPLFEVDDARYAEVPREMAASGDWLTPRLNFLDYVEKPPLWYWLAAASYKVFGVSEAAAHLPLALLSLLGLAGTAWLGSWLFSLRAGITAGVLLASSPLYFFLSHHITPDLPLAVFLLWSCAMILRALLRPADGRWAGPLAWAFAGLAFLSKGLVALIFPLGWTLALMLVFPELRKSLRGLMHPIGPLAFAVLVLPWFLLMERRHPGFLHLFFVEHHFQRYLTPKYNRPQPWYFFLLVLPAGILPWTPAALGAWAGALRGWRKDPAGFALASWVLLVAAFFSSSQSKLATYILPVLPHLALLAAQAPQEPPRWTRRFSFGLGILILLSPLTAQAFPELGKDLNRQAMALALAASVALGLGLLGFYLPGWEKRTLALGLSGLAVGALALAFLRATPRLWSAKELALAITQRYRPGDMIYAYGIYLHGIPFYTGRRVDRMVNWVGELHYAKRDPANAERFGDDTDIRKLPLPGRRVFVAFRGFEAPHLLTLLRPESARLRSFGKWGLAEVESPGP